MLALCSAMSGAEKARDKHIVPLEVVIDVDVPLVVPYKSTYGPDVLKFVETFKTQFPCICVNAGTKIQSVLHNGKPLQDRYAVAAAKHVYMFKEFENLHRQMCALHNINTVYKQPELKDEFANAIKDVHDLRTMLHASTPVQRAVKQLEELAAAAEVAKAAKACEAEQLGAGMSSGGGAARDSGKKRKDH